MHTESGHEVKGRGYVLVWLALMVLTGLSYGLSFVTLGEWSSVMAMGIAGVKALMVIIIFMHLLESAFVVRMVVLVNVLWILLLCLGIVADMAFR